MRTDLHIHTTASDGCWTPKRLIEGIVEQDIHLFAVTDHDSVDSVLKTEMLSRDIPAHFIRGVELSTTFHNRIIHILGYGINPASPSLVTAISKNRCQLMEENARDIHNLITLGYDISFNDYLSYEYDKRRGGWKSLNYMIDQNICRDLAEYKKIIRPQISHYVPNFVPLNDVVDAIHDAEGIAVLAHPGASLPSDDIEEYLDKLLYCGISGVECYAQYHDEITTRQCVAWCNSHNMLITGGSDYHGGFVNRKLGEPIVDHENELNLGPIFPNGVYK